MSILTAFNDSFDDFVLTIVEWFPTDADILGTKMVFTMMRKTNPKLLIKAWYQYVTHKYSEEIEKGDISFFIDKDYKSDFSENPDSDKIIESINRLRIPIQTQPSERLQNVVMHLKILNNLCNLYFISLDFKKYI